MTSDKAAAEQDDLTPSAPSKRGNAILRDPLVGRQLGRYDVLHRIASGGMGSVYVGRARGVADFERLVAVKVLHQHLAHQDDFIAMFLDEARLAAQIRHPNVVATVDVCPTSQGYFLVMEYVEGDHLAGLMRSAARLGERLPVPIVLRILVDSLMGLAAAHDLTDRTGSPLNLVHRDISPQNVLVGMDGLARLTDFGVAKAEHRISSTREGQFKGKLAYASPEQAATGEVEQRSDLFAMGVILWEALTGKRLFAAETNQATLKRLLDEPVPRLAEAAPQLTPLEPVLAKALARPLDERFQSAQQMAEALEAVAPSVGGIATTRAVAQAVRRLAADKIESEQRAIHEAVQLLLDAEPGGQEDRASSPHDEEVDTVRPPALGSAPTRQRSLKLWLAAAAVVAVAGAATAYLATRPEAAATERTDDSGAEGERSTAVPPAAGPHVRVPSDEANEAPAVEAGAEGSASEAAASGAATTPDGTATAEGGSDGPADTGDAAEEETSAEDEREMSPAERRRARRERLERIRRWRALQRQSANESRMAASEETDILENPYRGQ